MSSGDHARNRSNRAFSAACMISTHQDAAPGQWPFTAAKHFRNSQFRVLKRDAAGAKRCAPTRRDSPP
jgi:hypothetical protein